MSFLKLAFILVFLALAGGFTYFAVIDVPVEQKIVTKKLSNDRLKNL